MSAETPQTTTEKLLASIDAHLSFLSIALTELPDDLGRLRSSVDDLSEYLRERDSDSDYMSSRLDRALHAFAFAWFGWELDEKDDEKSKRDSAGAGLYLDAILRELADEDRAAKSPERSDEQEADS